MATGQPDQLVQYLRRTVLPQEGADLTDGQLLERYVRSREETVFAALVRRHGPMVWGVCLRVLRSPPDAEDAFQATFLVLVRKAASIVPREKIVNWLYGVAHQTALKARATAAKRRLRERLVPEMPEPAAAREDRGNDLQIVLDQELIRLPDKYRAALVLCDLEGKTRKEAARQLGLPEGTVASRLATARTMLAKRLARFGVTVPAGTLAAMVAADAASAAVPASVVSATIRAASRLAAGNAAAEIASLKVAALTEGVLKAMLVTKLKMAAVILLAASTIGLCTTVVTYRTLASEPGGVTNDTATKSAVKEGKKEVQDAEKPRTDPIRKSEAKAEDKEKERKEKPPEGRAGNNPKLRALLKERLESVRAIADKMKQLHERGAAGEDAVRQADLRVYKAELDLCETAKDRIAVLEKIVGAYKEVEDHLSQLVKQGAASSDVVLEAKITRLEAEIELERAKAKLAPPSK